MFSKTTLFLAFAAITSLASAASSPPGCLLGAVNSYSNPVDVSAICKAKDVTSKIQKFCGDDTEDALSAFADICNDNGVKISTKVPTSTGSYFPSGTASVSGYGNATQSGGAQATGSGSPMASGSGGLYPTGTSTQTGGPAESTGAAGKIEVSVAALLAGLGVMAAAF